MLPLFLLLLHALAAGTVSMGICLAGTAAGGLLAYALGRTLSRLFPLLIAMAAGMIFAMLALDVLPESVRLGGWMPTLGGMLAGWSIALLLDRWVHSRYHHASAGGRESFFHSSGLLGLALALHNFPAGFALGSSYGNVPELARSFSWAMGLHSIPEGIALGLPFSSAGRSPWGLAKLIFWISLPTLFGASAGSALGDLPPTGLSLLLGLSGGTILYVVLVEFTWPALTRTSPSLGWTAWAAGACLGVLCLLAA
ncbi:MULTISPECIES: ZIP family metal transporter [Paenibacillus]|uniref:ZIP family metal transporter n=1 Tax=Paenibacillus TaxID=44249 RepID=UPI0022B87CE7|nr:ZIP family metal transporter [Paenibacillus caseinilyticus]